MPVSSIASEGLRPRNFIRAGWQFGLDPLADAACPPRARKPYSIHPEQSMKLTEKALDEWRAQPVTALLKECLDRMLTHSMRGATQAYWAGNPVPEADRLAIRRQRVLWEQLFQSDAEEINRTMKDFDDDEYERTEDAGIQRSGEAGRGGDQDEGRFVPDGSGY